ncbi:helix-turn-helix domain-containing protein [Synechocystis salina LEGE 06099]|nr:helix-turn-helix domain-containing protein [Synechocystis salina LEGE 06099]
MSATPCQRTNPALRFSRNFRHWAKSYLQAYRLHGARRQLKLTSPGETTVMAIAHQWGFWHLGQFSQDYKKMFGELPSVTLSRP